MQLSPADKTLVAKFTLAAKKIIYNAQRFEVLDRMMKSKPGALNAVHTVLASIESHKHIPPQIVHQLGVNTYLVLVDMCQEKHQVHADPKIIHEVIGAIMHSVDLVHNTGQQELAKQPQATAKPAPSGIIAGKVGGGA